MSARPPAILLVICSALAHGAEPSVERGQGVYEKWCTPCHGAGKNRAGTMALEAKYAGTIPAELAKRTDLTPELIHHFLRRGVSIMPPFRKAEITVAEERDLISYLTRTKSKEPQ